MQKKIIALAVAAAFSAPAFADTNVYGVVDAAIANISASGQKSDTTVVSGGLASSRIGVKAAEDLNNGMKAVVVVEYGIDTQTAAGLAAAAARQQMLALAGDMGTFATGYLQTTGYDWAGKFDPLAGSVISPLQTMTGAASGTGFLVGSKALATRAPRALAYISPEMGGVTVALNYATDLVGLGNLGLPTAAIDAKQKAFLGSVTYAAGPLAVGGVIADLGGNNAANTAGEFEYALGASYDLTAVKLFVTYQSVKATTSAATANKAMSFSALAPVGPGAVGFSYAKSTIGTAAPGTNTDGSAFTVGYLQGLSKTTTAYVAYAKVSNGSQGQQYSVDNNAVAGATLTAGGSSSLITAGLNKKF